MTENQKTVSEWAQSTFGPIKSNLCIATRALQEMAELCVALAADDCHPKAAEEVADIFIVLYRLMERLGVNVQTAVNEKMKINRARTWVLDGNGQWQHK